MIQFHFHEVRVSLKQKRKLKQFIPELLRRYKKDIREVSFTFCSDEFLLAINREHLDHDYYTDIITFDLSADSKEVLADIYISSERVYENAKSHGVNFNDELLRVMFHGLLHICGLKDKTSRDIQLMRRAEDNILKEFRRFVSHET